MTALEAKLLGESAQEIAEILARHIVVSGPSCLSDATRARLNALTRKVTLSDEELSEWMHYGAGLSFEPTNRDECTAIARALRDRYEERGRYAPQPQESGTGEATGTARARSNPPDTGETEPAQTGPALVKA